MNDKELLELAAKAAGIEYSSRFEDGSLGIGYAGLTKWNPLTDDGDALRLAVKLNLDLVNTDNHKSISAGFMPDNEFFPDGFPAEWKKKNPCAATRRAIVRAAAEIGRMK